MSAIKLKVKLLLKASPIFYRYYYALKQARNVVNEHFATSAKNLCLEGYPSSGNSFLNVLLNNIEPTLNIAHHTHSIANIKLALSNHIPAAVIIRRPEDCVASRIIRFHFDLNQIDNLLLEYLNFYEYVEKTASSITVIPFEYIENDLQSVIELISSLIGRQLSTENLNEKINEALIYLQVWGREHRGKYTTLPDKGRTKEKQKIKKYIEDSAYFDKARHVYKELSKAET